MTDIARPRGPSEPAGGKGHQAERRVTEQAVGAPRTFDQALAGEALQIIVDPRAIEGEGMRREDRLPWKRPNPTHEAAHHFFWWLGARPGSGPGGGMVLPKQSRFWVGLASVARRKNGLEDPRVSPRADTATDAKDNRE